MPTVVPAAVELVESTVEALVFWVGGVDTVLTTCMLLHGYVFAINPLQDIGRVLSR